MLLNILLTIQIIVAILLGGAVLLQRSEGGALGMGGGPSGFMTARGQGDLLTRATWTLFTIFLVLCVGLTILQGRERAGSSIVGRGAIEAIKPVAPPAPTGVAPTPQVRGLPAPTTTTPDSVPGSAVDAALGAAAPAEAPPTN